MEVDVSSLLHVLMCIFSLKELHLCVCIVDQPNFDLTPPSLLTQCIWEEHPRNVTVLLSGFPQPSVSWARSDGKQISPDQTAFKQYFEPYWENGRRDEWMANLEVCGLLTLDMLCGLL